MAIRRRATYLGLAAAVSILGHGCGPGGGPALFGPSRCAGNVPYSFVGWTTTDTLHMQFDRGGTVFAMVTRDPVILTETDDGTPGWVDTAGGGMQHQLWGRKVCISQEPGTMEFGWVVGSTSVLWKDGLRVPGEDLVHP